MSPLRSLRTSFWSGLQGGVAGGVAAAMIISFRYGTEANLGIYEIAEVVLYTIMVGAVTGVSAHIGTAIAWRLGNYAIPTQVTFTEVIGSAVACGVGGATLGLLGARWFGGRLAPPIEIWLVVAGATLGGVVVLFDAVSDVGRLILFGFLPGLVLAICAFVLVWILGLDFDFQSEADALWDGITMGLIVGLMLGAQIGFGLFLHRRRTWPQQ